MSHRGGVWACSPHLDCGMGLEWFLLTSRVGPRSGDGGHVQEFVPWMGSPSRIRLMARFLK